MHLPYEEYVSPLSLILFVCYTMQVSEFEIENKSCESDIALETNSDTIIYIRRHSLGVLNCFTASVHRDNWLT
jgi:hypothetical protein